MPALSLRTHVAIVLHTREAGKDHGGQLACSVLANSSLHLHGRRDQTLDLGHLHEQGRRVLVLFPHEGAAPLTPDLLSRDPRPVTLVLPDGTWRKARRASLRIPGLDRAEAVRLPEPNLKTIEALARALEILEGDEAAACVRRMATALDIPRSSRAGAASPSLVKAEDPEPLDIIYRDDFLVAVNKPSGMIVHRGWANDSKPALQRLRDQTGTHVHAIHRLDRGTSGVLLFAQSPEVARDMQRSFESGAVEKRYIAICRGNQLSTQRLAHPLAREKGAPRLPAVTRLRLLSTFERYGLVEAIPETGRTHQIRKHLKHLAHPIIGDVRYGKGEHNRIFRERFGFHRLALHCQSLRFSHPRSGAPLLIEAQLPDDFRELVARFESRTEN